MSRNEKPKAGMDCMSAGSQGPYPARQGRSPSSLALQHQGSCFSLRDTSTSHEAVPLSLLPHSQLMKTMLIIVKMKKGRGSMATFTMIAVIKNNSPIATRLPKMRTCWGILQERVSVSKTYPPRKPARLGPSSPMGIPVKCQHRRLVFCL